ncbi:DNA gyrase subunit A [Chondromyces apiculatus]|uniref:DNA gyrase subunit A n=1 Tax=Chondromyces apiculatus DSM 436 TaxID=1192034 RepID=A0A017TF43_9BACT|nr:DNA gyrase subunit A [Chondromyces apiculatus]EYF07864.1 DNA gyrase subunit A [Chondromyces apiculatus DSM 436]
MEETSNIQQRVPVSIQDELRTSYLDYAMSVIIGRAIPDVRDGLKPVHRRILFSMHEQRIGPGGAHKKCARVVGDVLGKYHPHGDMAVYDALARMAQPFSLRYPLIDGQGNFGSIDGDSPAAMRYTESRLARMAVELIADIDKETVDFSPNYDDSELEPTVLPAKFPQLLVNGSGGIAVGMATNIPPHNLGEIIDATIAIIKNSEITLAELMSLVPGPDFPTGGLIYGKSGILQAYTTGRGSITMRARHTVEKTLKGDREAIIVSEIPYQVNKARLVAKIAECMKEKRVEGISEVRDESDREGMRIVIELKKDVFPQVVMNQLFRLTDLQATFGVNNLSIVQGRPAVLSLKETLEHFIEHRREVVTRRSRYELRQAEAQRELVEGLGMATTDIDRVVATIRASADPEEARARLCKLPLRGLGEFLRRAGRPEPECTEADAAGDYFLSERQSKAILEMRLSRLTGLEREKLAKEYGELAQTIERLRAILGDEHLLMNVIVTELEDIKTRFNDKRRTEIVAAEAEINVEDLIQEEDMVVTVSRAGYVKRTAASVYRAQKRGGKGSVGMEAREEDWVSQVFVASTHSHVFFFSDAGKVFVKKVYEIPQAARNAKGRAIVNFVGMDPGEKVAAVTPVPRFEEDRYVVTVTVKGQIKKTALNEYENYREKGIIGVRIEEGDQLLVAALTDGAQELVVATRSGMSIRFSEDQVRATGRATMGVKAIELDEGDVVIGMGVSGDGRDRVLAVCERGYGKQTAIDEFRKQSRGGKGVILIDASERNGPVVGVAMVRTTDEVLLVTDRGQMIRTKVSEIRETSRNAQGVRLMNVDEGERVVAIEAFAAESEPAEGGEGGDEHLGSNGHASDPIPEA